MPRESYYQPVGNPLQQHRLPTTRPTLTFACRDGLSQRPWRAMITWTLVFGVVSFVTVHLKLVDQPIGWPGLLWKLGGLLTGLLILVSLGHVLIRRTFLPVDSLVLLVLGLVCQWSLWSITFLTAVAWANLTWHVVRHEVVLATLAPFSPADIRPLRASWYRFTAVIAVFFVLAVVYAVASDSLFALAVVLVGLPLATILSGWFSSGLRHVPKVWWRGWQSWLMYHRSRQSIPGLAHSPVGSVSGRISFLLVANLLLAAAFFEWGRVLHQFNLVSIAGAVLWPPMLVWWIPFGLAFPVHMEVQKINAANAMSTGWQSLVDQMLDSPDPVERDSVFQGNLASDGSPLLVPLTVYAEHAHYAGDSGSGKTSRGLAPTIEQIIQRGDSSVVFVDLKADTLEPLASLEAAVRRARRRTKQAIPLKHFTDQVGHSTFVFNPMTQTIWNKLTLLAKADVLTSAMGLQYGTDYGQGYFSSANTALLHEALKLNPKIRSFRELAAAIGSLATGVAKGIDLHPEIRKAGVHVWEVAKRLAALEPLNAAEGMGYAPEVLQQQIELSDVFREPQVLYFHLSASLSPGSAPEIARLLTNLLLVSSAPEERRVRVYLVVDEFQRMVANNVEAMLQLARSMGVSVILANQSLQDLKTTTTDLIPVIEANCRYRQWFSVSSTADRELLMTLGGETIESLESVSVSWNNLSRSVSRSTREEILPRLSLNDIMLVSDHPRLSVVRISRGDGYAQYGGLPIVVESGFHITREEYERRKQFPWPAAVPGTIVPQLDPVTPAAPPKAGPVITTETIG